jgi:hypothetical protein
MKCQNIKSAMRICRGHAPVVVHREVEHTSKSAESFHGPHQEDLPSLLAPFMRKPLHGSIFESFFNLVNKSNSKNIKLIIAGPIDHYNTEFEELKNKFNHSNILILPSVISEEKVYLFVIH